MCGMTGVSRRDGWGSLRGCYNENCKHSSLRMIIIIILHFFKCND